MMNSVLMTAKETELTLESQSMSNHLAEFFSTYTSMTEQLAVNPQVRELLKETGEGDSILDHDNYATIFENLKNMTGTHPDTILATWFACTSLGHSVLTEPYVDMSTGQTIVSIASPIYDEEGTVLGVAGMDISMTQITAVMEQKKIGKSGYIMLLSADGLLVYHPDENEIQKNIADIDISENVITAAESGTAEFLKYKASGVSKYGYIVPVGTTGYKVISCLPSTEYYQQLIISLILFTVLFIVGIILIVRGMRKTAQKITKPIQELNTTAQQLAAGNFDVELQITSENEIGKLGYSFNETVQRLREYIAYIDEISEVLSNIANGNLVIDLQLDYAGEFQKVKAALLNISTSLNDIMLKITDSAGQVSGGADELAHASQELAESSGTQAWAISALSFW